MTPVRVLYIAGYSRSGSTLLLRLLSTAPRAVAFGELHELWDRSFVQDQLCGCGLPFSACPFWRQVTTLTFGAGPEDIDAARLNEAAAILHSRRSIVRHLIPASQTRAFQDALVEYGGTLQRLYGSITRVADADLVIDSSKIPQYAWLLTALPQIELHVCHLARDARASAFSWQRRRIRPEIHWQQQYMARQGAAQSSIEWAGHNLLIELTASRFASYTRIGYEDLLANPAKQLSRLGAAIGQTWDTGDIGSTVNLPPRHTASGNPSRFDSGEVHLRVDDVWRSQMKPNDRRVATLLPAPLLAHYRYPLTVNKVRGPERSLEIDERP